MLPLGSRNNYLASMRKSAPTFGLWEGLLLRFLDGSFAQAQLVAPQLIAHRAEAVVVNSCPDFITPGWCLSCKLGLSCKVLACLLSAAR